MLAGELALTMAALFTGAAFYVSFAEQTARLKLDDHALLAEWQPAYRRGFTMQAPLAVAGFILGVIAWLETGRAWFFAGGVLILANWPWTLYVMMPTNKTLMAERIAAATPATRELVVKWNKLHSVRTTLGALATVSFLLALA
jgi:hypothetical protein